MNFQNMKDSFSVSAAKALFEASKKPEIRNAAISASKDPTVRKYAAQAAKDPNTRKQVLNAFEKSQQSQGPPPPPPHRGAHAAKPDPPEKPTARWNATPSSSAGVATTSFASSTTSSTTSNISSKPKPLASTYGGVMSQLEGLHLGSKPATMMAQPAADTPYSAAQAAPTIQYPASATPYSAAQTAQTIQYPVLEKPKPARPPPPKTMSSSPSGATSEPHAIVKYPFAGSNFDELSCEPGDTVILKKEIDEQWLYGMCTRTGKSGIVPIGFLEIRIPLVPAQSTQSYGSHAQNQSYGSSAQNQSYGSSAQNQSYGSSAQNPANALYDYNSGTPGDLIFNVNEIIDVEERLDEDWLSGTCRGQRGIFPANFVSCPTLHFVPKAAAYNTAPSGYQQEQPALSLNLSASQPIMTVLAAHDYSTAVKGDISFKRGDMIEILERLDYQWIRGRAGGREGLAPVSFLCMEGGSPKSPKGLAQVAALAGVQKIVVAVEDHHITDDPSQLYFSQGDTLVILEEVDPYNYRGKLESFRTLPAGLFPKSKVKSQ